MLQANNWLDYETQALNKGLRFVFGVDEAGRGPLAGPVVAGAVWLKSTNFTCRIDDSKKLTPIARRKAFDEILENAVVGIGVMAESIIDSHNILNASHLAMRGAVLDLIRHLPSQETDQASFETQVGLLIDGNSFKVKVPYHVQLIVQGDAKSLSIACASIVAKVYRDRIMERYHTLYPQYGFNQHKGYPTRAHQEALAANGPSPIHRRSFLRGI